MSRAVFEYGVLQAVPRADRGECLNVGVVLYCQARDFLAVSVHVDGQRLRVLDAGVDVDGIEQAATALQTSAAAWSALPMASASAVGSRACNRSTSRWTREPR